MTLKYAKSKKGSKSKRKGTPRANAPLPLWRKSACNPAWVKRDPARQGEFVSATREYSNGSGQHRGHVCLAQCECAKALGARPKSEAEIIRAKQVKLDKKLSERHAAQGAVCNTHFTLLSVTGKCAECM
jgi:hypothetical protein